MPYILVTHRGMPWKLGHVVARNATARLSAVLSIGSRHAKKVGAWIVRTRQLRLETMAVAVAGWPCRMHFSSLMKGLYSPL